MPAPGIPGPAIADKGPTLPPGPNNPIMPLPPNPIPPLPNEKPLVLPGGSAIADPKQPGQGPLTVASTNPPDVRSSLSSEPVPVSGKQFGSVPEIGNQGGVSSPPIPVPSMPAAGVKAEAQSFDERKYICDASDTDFAAVCKHYYKSDKYAAALIEFNRDHPFGRDSTRQAPRLWPGAVVYLPPVHVLESKYGGLSGNIRPVPAANPIPQENGSAAPLKQMVPVTTSPGTGSPVPSVSPVGGSGNGGSSPQPPTPLNNSVTPAKSLSSPTPDPTANTKLYWVPQGGQRFWQIARETLGDATRWSEILRLNPQYNPETPVPGGAQIRLPADAHVGP
jgi:hypothetical protein